MGREPPVKTIASMMLGFALAAVGLDTVTGQLRMTFGFTPLLQGFDFLIAVIGLFGLGEILHHDGGRARVQGQGRPGSIRRSCWQTWKQLPQYWVTSLRAMPDRLLDGHHAGRRHARVVHELRHGEAALEERREVRRRRRSKASIAPETAAHAAGTSALLPMLTLGIPGSPTAAVLLGGLLIWGLQPGPLLFVEKPEFVWGLIASMYLGNIAGLIIVLTTVPWWAAILRIPFAIIAPVIVVICAIGAYTVHNNMFDVYMMVVFGVARLPVQEAQVSARAARARARARRHGRDGVPPVDAAVEGTASASSGRTRSSASIVTLALVLLVLAAGLAGHRGAACETAVAPRRRGRQLKRSRSTFFCTLPIALRGSSATTCTRFGTLNVAISPFSDRIIVALVDALARPRRRRPR